MRIIYTVKCTNCGADNDWLQEQSDTAAEGYTVTCKACKHEAIYSHNEIRVTQLKDLSTTH